MIFIVIRQTTDWGDERAVRAQLPDGIRPAVELWDATFDVPFHVFRRELTRIATVNLSRIPGAVCAPHEELPAGSIVVPCDDDDWFSPEMAATLEGAADGRHLGYYWPSRFIEVPISLPHELGLIRRALFPRTPPKWLCTTNNYAVVMEDGAGPLIGSHVKASRWFVANPHAVKRLDRHLSVMNRTLASQTSLRRVASRAGLLRKCRRYQRLYRKPIPQELAWCEPYVAMMRDLMDELRARH
jgi:hypothetical protein